MSDLWLILVYVAVSFLLAFFVETGIEYFVGYPLDVFDPEKKLKWRFALRYIAAAVGVGLAFYWQIDLVAAVANVTAYLVKAEVIDVWKITPLGIGLSGIAIGRGSDYLHFSINLCLFLWVSAILLGLTCPMVMPLR